MIFHSLLQRNLKTHSGFNHTQDYLLYISTYFFISLLLYEQFFLPWRQHELSSQVTTIFISRKVRYETRLRPTSRALLHSAIREKLHPFLATIPPSASRGGWFSILLSSRTNRLHHRLPGALKHPQRSRPPFPSFSHGNPSRHSTPAFFPSINRNSLGDSAGVGVVIRTGISLDCWKTGARGTRSRG